MRNCVYMDSADIRDEDIQDRDKAIIELYDGYLHYVKTLVPGVPDDALPPAILKYRQFVNEVRDLYGL
jgi:hypothetical protein